jgi:hypothetical protein
LKFFSSIEQDLRRRGTRKTARHISNHAKIPFSLKSRVGKKRQSAADLIEEKYQSKNGHHLQPNYQVQCTLRNNDKKFLMQQLETAEGKERIIKITVTHKDQNKEIQKGNKELPRIEETGLHSNSKKASWMGLL